MALVAMDGMPLVIVGAAQFRHSYFPAALGNLIIDAANEAVIMYGQIFNEDGGSHTINTSGSSSLGWMAGTVTFANAGSTFKVGIAALSTAGPPARADNVADVITFDVSKSLTGGGGGITTNAWNEHVPDSGSKTIAHGDRIGFCLQMTARGGTDTINVQSESYASSMVYPGTTGFLGGSYTDQGRAPNAVITYSDGTLGFFFGGFVASTGQSTSSFNSAASPNEYGNFFQMPFPVRIYGMIAAFNYTTSSSDADFVIYTDPLGTPVSQRSLSHDANAITGAALNGGYIGMYSSPYSLSANTPVAAIVKPTTANNVSVFYKSFNSSSHQKSEHFGTNGYGVMRTSGSFTAENSSKNRYAIGLIVGAFDAGGIAGRSVQINNDSLVA